MSSFPPPRGFYIPSSSLTIGIPAPSMYWQTSLSTEELRNNRGERRSRRTEREVPWKIDIIGNHLGSNKESFGGSDDTGGQMNGAPW